MNFDPTDDDLDRARLLDRELSDRLGLDPAGVPDRREFDRVDALALVGSVPVVASQGIVEQHVERLAIEELLDGSEYHAVSVTDESKDALLYHLRDMVHELRRSGYLSSSDDAGAIVASSQADGDEPTAMQLIRDSFEQYERVEQPELDDAEYAVDGVTVYPAADLPPGVVVAVAVDALADTPPGVTQPFVVRDRRGVEVLNVAYVGEA